MKLTEREKEVLHYICEGYTCPEIAKKLVVTHHTAEAHCASILDKLNAKTRAQAVYIALTNNLINFD